MKMKTNGCPKNNVNEIAKPQCFRALQRENDPDKIGQMKFNALNVNDLRADKSDKKCPNDRTKNVRNVRAQNADNVIVKNEMSKIVRPENVVNVLIYSALRNILTIKNGHHMCFS